MLAYPSIPGVKRSRGLNQSCVAFYKYDGSNLRWEWSPKRKWYKFGSRTQLFDQSSEQFGSSIELFKSTMADTIADIVCKAEGKAPERIVAFTEYYGESSFAGWHDANEPKDLVLLDISVYKKGFMAPQRFVDLFGNQKWCAKTIYRGNMTPEFIESVRHSWSYEGPLAQHNLNEGVVCKGDTWNAKIKTYTYLNKLKARFGDDWSKYADDEA